MKKEVMKLILDYWEKYNYISLIGYNNDNKKEKI